MTLDILRLTRTDTNFEYDLRRIQTTDSATEKPAFSISPPGASPQDNIFLGVQGQTREHVIRWHIYDDGSDTANGTATGQGFTDDTVVTIDEQIEWLEEHIHSAAFDAAWTVEHVNGDRLDTLDVYIERVSIPRFIGHPTKWLEAEITLREGESL